MKKALTFGLLFFSIYAPLRLGVEIVYQPDQAAIAKSGLFSQSLKVHKIDLRIRRNLRLNDQVSPVTPKDLSSFFPASGPVLLSEAFLRPVHQDPVHFLRSPPALR